MPSYKDSAGKWYCKFYYQDADGNRRQKMKRGFALKRDADAWERDFIQALSFAPTMPFSALYDLFQKDTAPRLKQHTIMNRYYLYKNRIEPFFGRMPICDITPAAVVKWQNQLIAEGLAQTYLSTCHVLLSSVFNHAVKLYGLRSNPCKVAGGIGSARPEKEMQFWTLDEYRAVIACVDDLKARTAITLLYWSGLRKGELLALTWGDLDGSTLTINKSLQKLRGDIVVTPPKTQKSNRRIKLPSQALDALRAWRGACTDTAANDYMFEWEKRFIEQGIKQGSIAAGVKRIRVHDLRHSHASLLIEKGYSPLLIAQRLGHEKIETTLNTYGHLWPNKENEMIADLENSII